MWWGDGGVRFDGGFWGSGGGDWKRGWGDLMGVKAEMRQEQLLLRVIGELVQRDTYGGVGIGVR